MAREASLGMSTNQTCSLQDQVFCLGSFVVLWLEVLSVHFNGFLFLTVREYITESQSWPTSTWLCYCDEWDKIT